MSYDKCRTCLGNENGNRLVKIDKQCWLEKSIKDVIIRIVPEMALTLFDEDFVCKKCLKIIQSTMEFIRKCLEAEVAFAERKICLQNDDIDDDFWQKSEENSVIENQEYEEECSPNRPSPTFEIINLDHDYCVNNTPKLLSDLLFPVISYYSDEDTDDEVEFEENNYTSSFKSKSILHTDEEYKDIAPEDTWCDTIADNENVENINLLSIHSTAEILQDLQDASNSILIETVDDEQHNTDIQRNRSQQFKRHQKTVSQKEKDSYICEICGKLCKTVTSLKQHMGTHNTEKLYMCDKCPKKFITNYRLAAHIKRSHERNNRHQCHECGKLFWREMSVQNHHRLVHLKVKPFVCCICDKLFGRKDYLQKHMAVHTGILTPQQAKRRKNSKHPYSRNNPKYGISLRDTGKPVPCRICGKTIRSVHLLKAHLETHINIRRFKCKCCNLSFTLRGNRDRHQKGHASDLENKFRCDICWKRLKTEEELTYHVSMHENRPPRYSCDICGEKFHRKYLLYNHHTEVHTSAEDIAEAENEIVCKNLLEYARL